jgi:toxin HigB-1
LYYGWVIIKLRPLWFGRRQDSYNHPRSTVRETCQLQLTKLAALYAVTGWVTLTWVIRSFRHKGLERFFPTGSKAGIQGQHAERLRIILGRLSVSITPKDMNLPGLDLHPLKGDRKGTWAVKVSGNWRITFTFVGKDADAVDYEDYH